MEGKTSTVLRTREWVYWVGLMAIAFSYAPVGFIQPNLTSEQLESFTQICNQAAVVLYGLGVLLAVGWFIRSHSSGLQHRSWLSPQFGTIVICLVRFLISFTSFGILLSLII